MFYLQFPMFCFTPRFAGRSDTCKRLVRDVHTMNADSEGRVHPSTRMHNFSIALCTVSTDSTRYVILMFALGVSVLRIRSVASNYSHRYRSRPSNHTNVFWSSKNKHFKHRQLVVLCNSIAGRLFHQRRFLFGISLR